MQRAARVVDAPAQRGGLLAQPGAGLIDVARRGAGDEAIVAVAGPGPDVVGPHLIAEVAGGRAFRIGREPIRLSGIAVLRDVDIAHRPRAEGAQVLLRDSGLAV